MWGSEKHTLLRFARRDWKAMIGELARRGAGWSEAGAFLLADRDGEQPRVTRIVYFDDLDPNCLQGTICFNGLHYSALWDICDAENRVVVGDVHSHPGPGVRQSTTDRGSPMVALAGHISVIVPDLAAHPVNPREAGIHIYRGAEGWSSWTGADVARRLKVRRFR